MKTLILSIMLVILAVGSAGCMVVDGDHHYRGHHYYGPPVIVVPVHPHVPYGPPERYHDYR